jgi:hypothetical protein
MSCVVVALFLFASTLFAQNVDAALLRHFDYDQKAPLDVQEAGVEQRGDVAIHDISYASPNGEIPLRAGGAREKHRSAKNRSSAICAF